MVLSGRAISDRPWSFCLIRYKYWYNLCMEQYEVVDEQGNQTGELVTKQVAHTQRVLHRVAGVLCIDDVGRYVIQYRKAKRGYRYYDMSVGGHVDPGETPLQAAIREAHEELGIAYRAEDLKVASLNIVVEDNYPELDIYARHLISFWTALLPRGWRFAPNSEVQEVLLLSADEIRELYKNHPQEFVKGFIANLRAVGILPG
jgi:8-oxo-dGTP pyrophosphatase MutT (NUDIX family)